MRHAGPLNPHQLKAVREQLGQAAVVSRLFDAQQQARTRDGDGGSGAATQSESPQPRPQQLARRQSVATGWLGGPDRQDEYEPNPFVTEIIQPLVDNGNEYIEEQRYRLFRLYYPDVPEEDLELLFAQMGGPRDPGHPAETGVRVGRKPPLNTYSLEMPRRHLAETHRRSCVA